MFCTVNRLIFHWLCLITELVKKETNKSHVQEFGDLSMAKEPVGDFQGNHQSDRNIYYEHIDVSILVIIGLYDMFWCFVSFCLGGR